MTRGTHEKIHTDHPLRVGDALKSDKLGREAFARAAVEALGKVTASVGYVVAIEGPWGSGKTSTLSMIEEVLSEQHGDAKPVVVHFNPWLIGDRDALLKQFLSKLAATVALVDHSKNGARVAKELKTYGKAFDVLRLIPGAEPWASIIKTVLQSVGEATGSIAELKTPDIEQQKRKVEEALRKFPKPIIVCIDDLDRLYPVEVFEMIRIIKAVGDLPHVGYLLAWDASYVTSALANASVPQAETYLDKIVQIRMPLPVLSLEARSTLIDDAFCDLSPDARVEYFPGDETLLSLIYYSGLRELMEQPRDIARVINALSVMEPSLRGEIALADVLGIAALMIKAQPVFDLLRSQPKLFVGRLPNDHAGGADEDIIKAGEGRRIQAYDECSLPGAVRTLVHFLFPKVAKSEGGMSFGSRQNSGGRVAKAERLLVALQQSVGSDAASFVAARKFLYQPSYREKIIDDLSPNNCLAFLECLGDVTQATGAKGIPDIKAVCISIACLVDTPLFVLRSRNKKNSFTPTIEPSAIRAIAILSSFAGAEESPKIAASLVENRNGLTIALSIFADSFLYDREPSNLLCAPVDKNRLTTSLIENSISAAEEGRLLDICNPAQLLWKLAEIAPLECPKMLELLKSQDPTLDKFALEILRYGFDSTKGQSYSVHTNTSLVEAYSTLEELREHGRERLTDPDLGYPARAAWRSLIEGKRLYGEDGTEVRR